MNTTSPVSHLVDPPTPVTVLMARAVPTILERLLLIVPLMEIFVGTIKPGDFGLARGPVSMRALNVRLRRSECLSECR